MSETTVFPSIQTERLLLREIIDRDVDEIFVLHSDPELMRWFGVDPLRDLAGAHTLIKKFANLRLDENPGARWGIQANQQPQLLGSCGLFRWNREWRKCLIGYELSTHAQKQGFMRETVSAVVSWGFAEMALNRIEALVHPDNQASLKLLRGLGFVDEGRLRQGAYWGGQHHDMLLLSLLRNEWPTANAD